MCLLSDCVAAGAGLSAVATCEQSCAERARAVKDESSLSSGISASERSRAQPPAAKIAAAKKRDKV